MIIWFRVTSYGLRVTGYDVGRRKYSPPHLVDFRPDAWKWGKILRLWRLSQKPHSTQITQIEQIYTDFIFFDNQSGIKRCFLFIGVNLFYQRHPCTYETATSLAYVFNPPIVGQALCLETPTVLNCVLFCARVWKIVCREAKKHASGTSLQLLPNSVLPITVLTTREKSCSFYSKKINFVSELRKLEIA